MNDVDRITFFLRALEVDVSKEVKKEAEELIHKTSKKDVIEFKYEIQNAEDSENVRKA